MENKSYELSEIVMAEKLKEKFGETTVNDELIGLNIYAAQKKFTEFRHKFDLFISDESEFEFNNKIASELGNTLKQFDTDEYKNDRLQMTEKIVKRIKQKELCFDSVLFQNAMFVYTES